MTCYYRTRTTITRSCLETTLEYQLYIFMPRIFWKNKEMVFENGVSNIQATAYNGGFMVFYWNWRKIKYDFINILTPYCVVECSNCRGSFLLCKWSICLLEIGTKKSNFSRVHLVRLCFYFKFASSPFLSIPKQNSKKKTQKVTNRKLFIFQSAL